MKNNFYCLLGEKLKKVKKSLSEKDYSLDICENSPPGKHNGTGIKRVITVKRIKENSLMIIWCYENYS